MMKARSPPSGTAMITIAAAMTTELSDACQKSDRRK
jgi:hypothetical protein